VNRLTPDSDLVVIVDVLSFTTAVNVATERGATVYPYRWADNTAGAFATAMGALLLGKRTDKGLSLAPSLPLLRDLDAGGRLYAPP